MRELSMHILDIGQNSISANAKNIKIIIDEDIKNDRLYIIIEDDGKGMDAEELKRVTDPFYTSRSTRRVGLGIPLFKASAEACDGCFAITSLKGKGTCVRATFEYSHIDRAPLGNIIDTIISMVISDINVDILYIHKKNEKEFVFDTKEIKSVLGEIPINNLDVIKWIKNNIKEGLNSLNL